MLKTMFDLVRNNKKTIKVTFEIFWIIVFLLKIITSDLPIEIPQFIYVNF